MEKYDNHDEDTAYRFESVYGRLDSDLTWQISTSEQLL